LPDRILIVRLSHLGDVVHALGVFHALHEAYPAAEIGWVTQSEFADLLDGLPSLSRIFRFGRRDGWRAWPRIRRELRAWRPDLAVDAQGNLKSAGMTLCSGAARRAGLARVDWRERLGSLALNDPAPPLPAETIHAMDRMLALARHVAPDAVAPLRLDAGLSEAERAEGEGRLAELLPEPTERAVLLHLSSPGDIRSWPLEHWRALAERLANGGRPLLVLSGPSEEAAGRELERDLPARAGLAHWVGQRGLRSLAAVLEAAGRRGMRLVCCDSGPMHLAVASGLPVLALGGPQDSRRTGPWNEASGGEHVSLRASVEPPCAPCLARRCDHPEGAVCMREIRPEQVANLLGE